MDLDNKKVRLHVLELTILSVTILDVPRLQILKTETLFKGQEVEMTMCCVRKSFVSITKTKDERVSGCEVNMNHKTSQRIPYTVIPGNYFEIIFTLKFISVLLL